MIKTYFKRRIKNRTNKLKSINSNSFNEKAISEN